MNIQELKTAFYKACGQSRQPIHCYFAPGRVNLIGEHIDYNGGHVCPAAISMGIYGVLRLRGDRKLTLTSGNMPGKITLDLGRPVVYKPESGWGNYPKGVVAHMQESGAELPGCDLFFLGDLPAGSGLSSSAALLILTAYMLRRAMREESPDRVELATFCQHVENRFMGLNCGIMDHFVIAMGRKDAAVFLNCQTLDYRYLPICLDQVSLVLLDTRKAHELTDSKYNQCRKECEEALALLQAGRKMDNLCQASLYEIECRITDSLLKKRARHVVSENLRVLQAEEFMRQQDWIALGRLLTASHKSLQMDYEVSGPELDTIVDVALQNPECLGARMTGAGFGGSAIALVSNAALPQFEEWVSSQYERQMGKAPGIYPVKIRDGVGEWGNL